MVTINTIKQVLQSAIVKTKPDKVILFGSYAYGQPNKDSDVDVLFVYKGKNISRKYRDINLSLGKRIFPMDILVKTNQEVKKRIFLGDYFYKDIMANGLSIYDRT